MDLDYGSRSHGADSGEPYSIESHAAPEKMHPPLHADALRAERAHLRSIYGTSDTSEIWAKGATRRLESAQAALHGDHSEKLKAEAWAVKMVLNEHGLEIRRDTQRALEKVLRGIL